MERRKVQKSAGNLPGYFLSFAGVKGRNFELVREKISLQIVNLYQDNCNLLGKNVEFYNKISMDMDDAVLEVSLLQLSRYLYEYHGKKVIILLDEYDTSMQEAYLYGYWDDMAELTRGLLNATFKTNPYLERGLMTGITRISKESIFSDLNNIRVVTTTTTKYETFFGFTELEVNKALDEYGLEGRASEVKRWYDGFRFGECDSIYNPWSIILLLDEKKFAPYWVNTSSNALVGKLIKESNNEIKMIMEELLKGGSFRVKIDEQIAFNQLNENSDAVWSLFLASGYLKIVDYHLVGGYFGEESVEYELALTNLEIVLAFRKIIHGWFPEYKIPYNDFIKAMLINDVDAMNAFMGRIARYMISFFDTGRQPSDGIEPERFYHGFVLGLIVELHGRYSITSNRESGFGRYDVMLEPCDTELDDGIILEFKVMNSKKEKFLEDTVQAALQQIIDKKYTDTLEKSCKRERIRIYGFAFRGKEVLIDGGYFT